MSYSGWSLKEVKEELKKRGAKLSGRKLDLVERLEAYDRNQNFGFEALQDDYQIITPDSSLYKDMNADTVFTNFKQETIDIYLAKFDKKLEANARNLYSDRFIKFIRLAISDSLFYVGSQCMAEMKKTVSYKIDAVVDMDGSIIETQCECAAGMGPNAHCKHVCAVLFALYQFSQHGNIMTEQTCTQRLQTFHHCKAYMGSPIKAGEIPLYNKCNMDVRYDPRPPEYRNTSGYNDYFRNLCLNYPRVNRFPIAQVFPPANTYAAAEDHDYSKLSQADIWLEQTNILKISPRDIALIEYGTRGQSSNEVWFSERCKRITSSLFGRICKATSRTDFPNLACSLTTVIIQLSFC
ncbi:hypothetical protein ScPMuIL_004791 [Solemya velum]